MDLQLFVEFAASFSRGKLFSGVILSEKTKSKSLATTQEARGNFCMEKLYENFFFEIKKI